MKKALLLFVMIAPSCLWAQVSLTTTTLSQAVNGSLPNGSNVGSVQTYVYLTSLTGVNAGLNSIRTVLYVDREMMAVDTVSVGTNQVNVLRGYNGTLQSPHASGATVFVGSPDQFYSFDPAGACNAPLTKVTPWINYLTGSRWTCTAGVWALTGGPFFGATLPSNVYQATLNGLACNGTYTGTGTDDTAALNTLLATVNSAGGGTIVFPAGQICLFNSAEITLPNNNDTWTDGTGTISSQAATRWTCGINGQVQFQELMSTGATISQIQNACVINDTFNAADAKFVSLGLGHLEVDHLSFIDTSTDSAAFWLFTNTQPDFHDNAFIGTTISQTGGPYSTNDVFIFGGATAVGPCKTVNCWFQGYAGQRMTHNFYNAIKRAAVLYAASNTLTFRDETVWSQSGCSTCGAFEIQAIGAGAYGNSFENLHIEVVHYLYGVRIAGTNGANNNNYADQLLCSDASEFNTICMSNAGDVGAVLIGQDNAGAAGYLLAPSDVLTNAIITNTNANAWRTSLHWNGFINLIPQVNGASGLAGTAGLWDDFAQQRPVFTKWATSTKYRIAAVEEVPTTQASLATDNFTRANAATLGANWTAINSLTSLQILSNTAATQGTGAYEGNAYTATTFPNDQFSQCTLGTVVSNTNNYVGCAVRIQSGAQSLYLVRMDTAGSTLCAITKFTAGTQTTLQACSGVGWSSTNPPIAGDVITLTAIGNTITAYKNGIQLATTTDSSFPTGSPGIVSFASSVSTAIAYTAWAGGAMDCTTGAVTSASVIGGVICGGPLANASTVQKSESAADANVLTFASSTVPGTYRVNFALSTSAANTATLGWTATWTDSNGTAKTPTNLPICAASTGTCAATSGAVSAADDYSGSFLIDTNNSGTNIVLKLTFSGTSFTGKASASVERVQ